MSTFLECFTRETLLPQNTFGYAAAKAGYDTVSVCPPHLGLPLQQRLPRTPILQR